MAWINTSLQFPNHCVIFTMTRMELLDSVGRTFLDDLMMERNPDAVHNRLRLLLLKFRPELSGGVIEWMQLLFDRQALEFAVSHDSLPKSHPHAEYRRSPLDPKAEQSLAEVK